MIGCKALTSMSAALVLVLAAPAFAGDDAQAVKSAERLELARSHAGAPVERVRFLRPAHKYEVIDTHALLVWQTPSRAWLVDVEVDATCRDVGRPLTIGIETVIETDTMNTKNSYIRGEGMRCKISALSEVDVPAMRAAKRSEAAGAS